MSKTQATEHNAAAGDYTTATQVLNAIPSKFALSDEQEDDIDDIALIFSILSARGVDALTQGDIDDLIDLSDRPGHASSMARGILGLHGYRFDTRFELPGGDSEERIIIPSTPHPVSEQVSVYPNPVDGSILNVDVNSDIRNLDDTRIDIWTITGVHCATARLANGQNSVNIPDHLNGILVYRITSNGETLKMDRIVLIRH